MSQASGHTRLDARIKTLVENGVAKHHRSLFVIVGDKGKDQIPTLHHILTKATVGPRPSMLWCYKKELGFSSNRQKRARQLKKKGEVGNIMLKDNPLDIFLSSTQIRYCYYSETKNILGNTYGMLVLQDFEAITPNLLARTIETVEGGGLVVLLLHSVNSLRQLYTISMDVHNRYRTSSSGEIVARFNERFILSLSNCHSSVVMDDALQILPISSHMSKIQAVSPSAKNEISPNDTELQSLKEQMKDSKPIGFLLGKCCTLDQAKTLLRLIDVLTDKQLTVTCSITAGRGRGKSAAMGLAVAAAASFGYTNIFVTSPSPENLKTFFQFVVKGFQAMEWKEHMDFELVQSTNPEFNKALVRINVTREHRQVVQYIDPRDADKLGQAELVIVDEAAAIPLPLVKQLISGPYLVFLASTISGYEGTGRSLSMKLLSQLKAQSAGLAMELEESIRYRPGDEVEAWLSKVLCLDSPSATLKLTCGTPPPAKCQLYYVNRDTLFSFHKASEAFLNQVMSIYVSAHYKNSPNDLQMLSDAPAHHLFVLMAPIKKEDSSLPQVLAVVQLCLEGNIARAVVSNSLSNRQIPAGDLLPWTVSQQFQDKLFPSLCGGRIIRIAVHPDYQGMGYGSRALEILENYYLGKIPCLSEEDDNGKKNKEIGTVKESALGLLEEQISPRATLPPLLLSLEERKAERLDYLGSSFGLTLPLFKFWKRAFYVPVYLRQSANDITGEHSCIVLKQMVHGENEGSWLSSYWREFRSRFIEMLSFDFRKFPAQMAFSLLHLPNDALPPVERKILNRAELSYLISDASLARLTAYSRSMIDNTLITDLLPVLARIYFLDRLPLESKLSAVQAAILVGMGLQRKEGKVMAKELDMPLNQIMAVYNKTIHKLSQSLDSICEGAIKKAMDFKEQEQNEEVDAATNMMKPLAQTLEEDLKLAAEDFKKRQDRDRQEVLEEFGGDLSKYSIGGSDADWKKALATSKFGKGGTVSLKSKRKVDTMEVPDEKDPLKKKKQKKLKIVERMVKAKDDSPEEPGVATENIVNGCELDPESTRKEMRNEASPRSPSPTGSDLWRSSNSLLSQADEMLKSDFSPLEVLRTLFPNLPTPPDSYSDGTILSILSELLDQPPKRKKLPQYNTFADAVELFRNSKRILILTGAGVSVSCGIPDFRSKDGIYARLHEEFPDLPDPTAMFDISYFRRNPAPFYDFAKEIFPGQFEPSISHKFIKCLEDSGQLLRNYTQNIDTLEHQTGITRVIECHGSFSKATCLLCGAKFDGDVIREDVKNNRVAHCSRCVQGVIKPDIVFFGEDLGEEFHRQMAIDKHNVDLVVVIGSSLKVRPVSLIPFSVGDNVPQILINREPLPAYTTDIELIGNCDDIITQICMELGGSFTELLHAHEARLKEKNKDSGVIVKERVKRSEIAMDGFNEIMERLKEEQANNVESNDHGEPSSPKRARLEDNSERFVSIESHIPKDSYFVVGVNRCVFPGAELHFDLEDKKCVVVSNRYMKSSYNSSNDDSDDDEDERELRGGSEPAPEIERKESNKRGDSCEPRVNLERRVSVETMRQKIEDGEAFTSDSESENIDLLEMF
ncbi:unnamed protein product, partial [Mesorhabditis belari]|uniref:RNA cytidine acetyltransferase n=1 Tax=Mesorhabditis belari TaxID=2138241 RepID=A0AAF3JAH4_9BILA